MHITNILDTTSHWYPIGSDFISFLFISFEAFVNEHVLKTFYILSLHWNQQENPWVASSAFSCFYYHIIIFIIDYSKCIHLIHYSLWAYAAGAFASYQPWSWVCSCLLFGPCFYLNGDSSFPWWLVFEYGVCYDACVEDEKDNVELWGHLYISDKQGLNNV
jgi:hypothetical protein